MVLLGFDRQCVNPKLPIALGGYAKKRIAFEIHDSLYTRCIAMEDCGKKYLLAQCDCIALDDTVRFAVLAELAKQNIWIEEAHFVLLATHTHSGPAGTLDTSRIPFQGLQNVFGAPNHEYQKLLTDKITLAAKNAFENLSPCTLTIAHGTIEGVGTERHDPDLPGDNSLLTLLFERKDGKRVLIYNYACHPTVLPPDNLLLTADLPYGVEQALSRDYDMVMFINSCCGDISTRFTRTSGTYEQIAAYSQIITRNIQNALTSPIYHEVFEHIDISQYPITLPAKQLGTVAEETLQLKNYQAKLSAGKSQGLNAKELRILESYVEGAEISVDLARTLQGFHALEAHFSIIKLQDLIIAVIPGELFSTLGRKLKNNHIEVFCYGNGYYLYFADQAAYDLKYYEAMSSPFAKGVGELLINEIQKTIKE